MPAKVEAFSPELLRTMRESRDITCERLASYVNLNPNTISKYERGVIKPSDTQWGRIYAILINRPIPQDTWREVQEQFKYEPVTFTFTEGQCYSIRNKGVGGAHNVCAWNVEDLAVLRYVGKHGIHHCFKDIRGGWGRTYTDAQLIGKKIKEVTP